MKTPEEIKALSDQSRDKVKDALHSLFKIPEGYRSATIDELVDSLITCAVLEVAATQLQAQKNVEQTAGNLLKAYQDTIRQSDTP